LSTAQKHNRQLSKHNWFKPTEMNSLLCCASKPVLVVTSLLYYGSKNNLIASGNFSVKAIPKLKACKYSTFNIACTNTLWQVCLVTYIEGQYSHA